MFTGKIVFTFNSILAMAMVAGAIFVYTANIKDKDFCDSVIVI